MAYQLRNVIDVSNRIQPMALTEKSFGFPCFLQVVADGARQRFVAGPFYDTESMSTTFGSNATCVKMANTYFAGGWYGKPAQCFVGVIEESEIADTTVFSSVIDNILAAEQDYYIIIVPDVAEFTDDLRGVVSAKVESSMNPKICMHTTENPDAYDANLNTDLGAFFKSLNYDRTWTLFDNLRDTNPSVNSAVASLIATVGFTTGRPVITLANKKLTGVAAIDLPSSAYPVLEEKRYNFYTRTTELITDMLRNSVMSSGQFLDTIQSADWFAYRLKYALLNLFQTQNKVPFDAVGYVVRILN